MSEIRPKYSYALSNQIPGPAQRLDLLPKVPSNLRKVRPELAVSVQHLADVHVGQLQPAGRLEAGRLLEGRPPPLILLLEGEGLGQRGRRRGRPPRLGRGPEHLDVGVVVSPVL